MEEGRAAYGRLNMLVAQPSGQVIHVEFDRGPSPLAGSAVRGLIKALLRGRARPQTIFIANKRLEPVLQPFCSSIGVQLELVERLPEFEAAFKSLAQFMERR